MPIIVTAGQIHSAGSQTAIKSAEITVKTALNIGQRLAFKNDKNRQICDLEPSSLSYHLPETGKFAGPTELC